MTGLFGMILFVDGGVPGQWTVIRHGGRQGDAWHVVHHGTVELRAREAYERAFAGMRQGGVRLLTPQGAVLLKAWARAPSREVVK